jgi:hypothetical protein
MCKSILESFPPSDPLENIGEGYFPHRDFLKRCESSQIARKSGAVTNFCDWLYDVYLKDFKSKKKTTIAEKKAAKERGKRAEVELEREALDQWLSRTLDTTCQFSEWRLMPCGVTDQDQTYQISALAVDDQPIQAKPDVVLQNEKSGEVLIVERKSTPLLHTYIPRNAWPNLLAELWCYSHIDEWFDAPQVYLVTQILRENEYRPPYPHPAEFCPRWHRSDLALDTYCLGMFQAYGGSRTKSPV